MERWGCEVNLLPGKVPNDVLQQIVFKNLGMKRDDVIVNPSIGEDSAIVKARFTEVTVFPSSGPILVTRMFCGGLLADDSRRAVLRFL